MPVKTAKAASPPPAEALYFQLFNEIGIIAQLSGNRFQKVLPLDLTVAQFTLLNHAVRLGHGGPPAPLSPDFQVTKVPLTNTTTKLQREGLPPT